MKKTTIAYCGLLSGMLLINACGNKPEKTENTLKGVDISAIDSSVHPGDDFFLFANGSWVKNTEIPPSQSAWGAFNELRDNNLFKLKEVIENAVKTANAKKGSYEQVVADFYTAAMDSNGIEKSGISALSEQLDLINNINTTDDLIATIAYFHTRYIDAPFNIYIGQDAKQSETIITHFYQGGIGLPDCDYYKTKETEAIREHYKGYIANMFTHFGDNEATAKTKAMKVYKIEERLAKSSMNSVEQRNLQAQYNKKTTADFQKETPNINWNKYFEITGIKNINEVIVSQPAFFKEVNKMIKEVSIDDWKTYLQFRLINDLAPTLNMAFVNEQFNFYGKNLYGSKELKPRWKRSIEATDRSLGDALGKLFTEKYFTEEAKKKVNEMVDNLIAAFKDRLASRTWMSDSTKKQAYAKLDLTMRKLGFPDKWKDYSSVDIVKDAYAKNKLNCNHYAFKKEIDKLGKPVDRTEWGMSPPTVNAYYNPSMNEIVFPAGIMQYPFFDINQDDALNYGGMGAVIGHELTHGFDDQGSQFDAKGNMVNWWTKEDSTNFKGKTGMVVSQFDNYIALDSLHVRGQLTLGENIADLGGLTIAYYAYMKSLEGKEKTVIDGFTPEQRFFMGWAKVWCIKYTPQSLKQQVLTNVHSPGMFRVNGPVSNMQEFYDAFKLTDKNKLYRPKDQRAEIW